MRNYVSLVWGAEIDNDTGDILQSGIFDDVETAQENFSGVSNTVEIIPFIAKLHKLGISHAYGMAIPEFLRLELKPQVETEFFAFESLRKSGYNSKSEIPE